MDDIRLLRDFAPEPPLDAREIQLARLALTDHIDHSGSRRLAFHPRGLGRPRTPRSFAIAGVLLVAAAAAVGAGSLRYIGEWGPVDHPATVATLDREIAETMAAIPLPPGYRY